MSGRPKKHCVYSDYGFDPVSCDGRTAAICHLCKYICKNTSKARLQAHRNVCKGGIKREAAQSDEGNGSKEVSREPDDVEDATFDYPCEEGAASSKQADSSSSSRQPIHQSHGKSSGLHRYMDSINGKEIRAITEGLCNLFYEENLPFRMVEAESFKKFIKVIRPAFAQYVPNRKQMATTLLDEAHQRSMANVKTHLSGDASLIMDSWKNTSSNTKTMGCIITTSQGAKAFIEAHDTTEERETSENLCHIAEKAIEKAREVYGISVYSIITDNAANMICMGRQLEDTKGLWFSTCSSHIGNLLAKDVMSCSRNQTLIQTITCVIKEFRKAANEAKLVKIKGKKMLMPSDTRWSSYRDTLSRYLENIPKLKEVAADETSRIESEVIQILYDQDIQERVRILKDVLHPISELINKCQADTCSIADATHLWLELVEAATVNYMWQFEERAKMALNVYALSAYTLHPFYKGSLNDDQKKDVKKFLVETLNADGLAEWAAFKNRSGFFRQLDEKKLNDPILYWELAEDHFPQLASVAKRLLMMPASSAAVERCFSQWSIVHTSLRNRLGFETSSKLIEIYYNSKLNSKIGSNQLDVNKKA